MFILLMKAIEEFHIIEVVVDGTIGLKQAKMGYIVEKH